MKHIKIFEEFSEKVVTFTNKRNPRLVIKVTKTPDGRITDIDNPTGIRFCFSVGQLFNEKFPLGKHSIKSIGFNTKNRFDDTYIERQIPIKGRSFEDILNDTLNFGVWLDNIQLTLYKYNDRNSNK